MSKKENVISKASNSIKDSNYTLNQEAILQILRLPVEKIDLKHISIESLGFMKTEKERISQARQILDLNKNRGR